MDKEAMEREVAAAAAQEARAKKDLPQWVNGAVVRAASSLGYQEIPPDLYDAAEVVLTERAEGYTDPPTSGTSSPVLAGWVAAYPQGRLRLADQLQQESGGGVWQAIQTAAQRELNVLTETVNQAVSERAEDLIEEQEATLER